MEPPADQQSAGAACRKGCPGGTGSCPGDAGSCADTADEALRIQPQTDLNQIRQNLIAQLTSPVRWTQTVRNMIADGATQFIEYGPGKVLTGRIHKIDSEVEAVSTDKRED